MIKKYHQFILEYNHDIKSELLNYFDSNKSELEKSGLDYLKIRNNLQKSLEILENSFVEKIVRELSSVDKTNKVELAKKLEEVIKESAKKILEKTDNLNESFVKSISNFFLHLNDTIKKASKWVSDRLYTISGSLAIGLSGLLLILSQLGFNFNVPTDFKNVLINSVLILGITALKYGQKSDAYKNVDEI